MKPERKKTYPSSCYSGISDHPDSWGMCCSEEMARKCAEDYWDMTHKWTLGGFLFSAYLILVMFAFYAFCGVILGVVWSSICENISEFMVVGPVFFSAHAFLSIAKRIRHDEYWACYDVFEHFEQSKWVVIHIVSLLLCILYICLN